MTKTKTPLILEEFLFGSAGYIFTELLSVYMIVKVSMGRLKNLHFLNQKLSFG